MAQLSSLVILFVACQGHAATGPGVAGSPLLAQPVGARPLALGASYTALADDTLALLWNPAGLVGLRTPEFGLTFERDPGEVSYGYLLYGQPLPLGQRVAAGLGTLRTPQIDYVDLAGVPNSVSGQSDWLLAVGYAASLIPFMRTGQTDSLAVSGGVTAKYLRTSLGGGLTGRSPTIDLGGMLTIPVLDGPFPLRVGAAWQNAGARIAIGEESDRVASPIHIAIAQSVLESPMAWTTATVEGIRWLSRPGVEWHAGVEQVWKPGASTGLALRAGYRIGADLPGLSGGLGIRWNRFVFDYSLARLGELGMVHRVGLRVRWE